MPLSLQQKKALVAEVNDLAVKSLSAIAAEYRGLTVDQMTMLRARAREQGVAVRVVKNTLAKRAFEGTDFQCISEQLTGPLILAFSQDDPGAAARIFKDFAKDHEALVARACAIGGVAYPGEDLNRLATLPTLEQARSMFLGLLKAPATKLVRTLAEPPAKFARLLAAHRDQQQAA